jgi:predicted RNA-binding protein YlxR (DUF448 family)
MRFVIDPENNLVADINQKLPGRGYWVRAERDTILKAINKNILFNATKKLGNVDKNILDHIQEQIKKKILNQISLSRKSGLAIFGFDKIRASLTSNNVGLLVQAIDGSDREKKRMANKSIPIIIDNCLTGSDLGKAFGREKVIHCAILRSSFTETINFDANRLNNLKNPVPQYSNVQSL